jgi:hypothetical protein
MNKVQTGKGKYGDRVSVFGNLVDVEKATELGRAKLAETFGEDQAARWSCEPLVVICVEGSNNNATVAAVTTEGRGCMLADGTIDMYGIADWTWYAVAFTQEELMSVLTDIEVDLADHVRVFGDRLENNYSIWQSIALDYKK